MAIIDCLIIIKKEVNKGSALDFGHMDILTSCKMLFNTSRLSIIDSVASGSKNVQSQGLTPWKKKEVLASKQ